MIISPQRSRSENMVSLFRQEVHGLDYTALLYSKSLSTRQIFVVLHISGLLYQSAK
jgi:hypothetical protein